MKQFEKILLCVHPEITDLGVVDHAARIAAKHNATIRVMHTIADYPEDISEWWNVRNPEQLRDQIVGERQGYLDGIAGRLQKKGVDKLDTKLRWGTPFLEITREVLEGGHDLVVITALRKTKFAKKMMECPSLDLMRHCPCALWVTQGKMGKRFQRVVAALGGDGGNVPCDGLNEKIVETAASFAHAEGSELHLVHVLPLYGGEGKHLRPDLHEYLNHRRKQIQTECSALLGKDGPALPEDQIHLVIGSPEAAVLADFIKKEEMNLVVMGTMTRMGVPGLLLGDTAEKVFNNTQTGVLSVKPDGFESLVAKEEAAERRAKGP